MGDMAANRKAASDPGKFVWSRRQDRGAWAKRTINGKLRWGPGHIIRSVCEPFLIACRKGHRLRGPDAHNLIETLDHLEFGGVARENSRKPDEFYHLVEHLTPNWRRADIFGRQSRRGWKTWGLEKKQVRQEKVR